MQERRLVPTKNLERVDELCGMIRHAAASEDVDIRVASIQNRALGGVNTCMFLKRFE
jgi:3-oxoacyl-(acyl-carrier-protein) synthase